MVKVAAGERWDDFVATAVAKRWAGIECLSGIPGSAGATPIQNVGAYGQDVSETIARVEVLEVWWEEGFAPRRSDGFVEAMRTPDSTLVFVDPERFTQIVADQVACMGCLSTCRFSNWSQHEPDFDNGKKADPRSFCIQKTLQQVRREDQTPEDIEHQLMFSGHNAYRFASDPFYSNGASARFPATTNDTGEVVGLAVRLGAVMRHIEAHLASPLDLEALCERIVAEHDYDLACLAQPDGIRRYANLRKLIGLARDYEALRGPDLPGFLGYVDAQGGAGAREAEAPVAEDEPEEEPQKQNLLRQQRLQAFTRVAAIDRDDDLLPQL